MSMWSAPERGLWVASVAGTYLGMIELSDDRFLATNEHGRSIGSFDSLSAAQSAVASATPSSADSPLSMALIKVAVLLTLLCASAAGATGLALIV
jgi:hypothetical protein